MVTKLVVGNINFNDAQVVERVMNALRAFAAQPSHYRLIRVKNNFYFEIPDKSLPSESGWYVLLVGTTPVYVGRADNLDYRLNSTHGSLDNYANSVRKSDPERNLVKKLCDLGSFSELRVWFVTAAELAQEIGLQLVKLDTGNVEKFINLNRGFLEFQVGEPSFNVR